LRADEHGTFNTGLFPALGTAIKCVDDSVGGYAKNGVDSREIALEYREVEFGVCTWGWWRVRVSVYSCGIRFVVGDGWYAIRWLSAVSRFSWCLPTHGGYGVLRLGTIQYVSDSASARYLA
jgi:hypothetical protein